MDNDIIVSIIVPAYNAKNYIEKCIQSIIIQTYSKIQILIVIDDTCVDGTNEIVEKFALKDSRIQIIRQHAKRQGEARNEGIDNAVGKYILFLDADDWLEITCCERVIEVIENYEADLVFFNYFKEYGNNSVSHIAFSGEIKICDEKRKDFPLYDMKNCTPWGKLYRRSIIGELRFNTEVREAEDVEFNYRLYSKVRKAIYIKDQLLHYRVLHSSAIHGFDERKIEKFEQVLEIVRSNTIGYDIERKEAYYSFAAIAYIVVCQNCVYLNPNISWWMKLVKVHNIGNREEYKSMFANTKFVKIPFSRKIIVLLGKYNINMGVLMIIWIKNQIEKFLGR